jgi:hypothetical protein
MPHKPRADDDEDFNLCLGTGCIGQLKDSAARGKRVSRPIGFVHFPEKPEKKARAVKPKLRLKPKSKLNRKR